MSAVRCLIPRLTPANTVLLICDMQEKFRGNIQFYPEIIAVAKRLVQACNQLDMKIIATEQYPKGRSFLSPLHLCAIWYFSSPLPSLRSAEEKYGAASAILGLGPTVPELELSKQKVPIFEKKKFSMCIPSVSEVLGSPKSVILCGIEAHVCVQHTTFDMLDKGIGVHVVADAVSSRSNTDRMFGLRQMEKAGAVLTTSENVILGLLGGADHPKFREVQKIIMDSAPDTGLLPAAHL
ncbi:unnamed protein product [Toxocara canis]|uniref:Isochorismatase domain-containing protein 1 n=1 Tax=Toxocara canis TaxID=6265 RepID=A0A183URJ0_TOXCA|nr:unnamed protein product [Toxocara canis]